MSSQLIPSGMDSDDIRTNGAKHDCIMDGIPLKVPGWEERKDSRPRQLGKDKLLFSSFFSRNRSKRRRYRECYRSL